MGFRKEYGQIMKIDPTVKKETLFVSMVTLVLSMLMQSVFLIIGKWDLSVLLGNVLGGGIGILNFFFLGLSVQKAVSSDEKKAKEVMKASHAIRFALIIVLLAISLIFQSVFNVIATIISLLFATFGVYMRAVFNKDRKKQAKGEAAAAPDNAETAGGDEE